MTAIKDNPLVGMTITYNDVQFGGSDSDNRSVPPQYSLVGRFIYDKAGIAVKHTEYTLVVHCVFYSDTESGMKVNADALKLKLSQPGKKLTIEGLGIGFGEILSDDEWGPKPQGFEWHSMGGRLAWECVWSVKFCLKHCSGSSPHSPFAFTAFNFETSWQNDFEGITSRTISGHVEIVGKRKFAGNTPLNIPDHVADEVRNQIKVRIPTGFQRITNVWREGYQKNVLEFVIVDQMLAGTAPPEGVISSSGSTFMQSEGPAVGSRGIVGISMDIRTSLAYSPALAGTIFLQAALTKQKQLNAQDVGGKQSAVAIPKSLYIVNRKYNDARQTSASMSWAVTRCLGSMMEAAKIWEPLTPNDYTRWRASVENLWDNRGASIATGSLIRSDPNEAVIIDLCTNKSDVVIGASTALFSNTNQLKFKFICPEIAPDGGWIVQDLKIRILRKDNQAWHRKAVPYVPIQVSGTETPSNNTSDVSISLNDPSFESTSETEYDVEQQGLPETYVALSYRALRAKHKPVIPIIESIAGLKPIQIESSPEDAWIAFDTVNCPVWGIRGYRIYRVNGYIRSVKATESLTSCSAPNGNATSY